MIGVLPESSWEEGVLKDTSSKRRGWRERARILLSQHSLRSALIAAGTWLRCDICGPRHWKVC